MGLPAPAERAARVPPKVTPEIVFEERRFTPMLVVETTTPEAFVARMAEARFVKPKFVVVALVVVESQEVRPPANVVEAAVQMFPLAKAIPTVLAVAPL